MSEDFDIESDTPYADLSYKGEPLGPDMTDEEIQSVLNVRSKHPKYNAVAFASPMEMFATYSEPIQNGEKVPHEWQIWASDLVSSKRFNKQKPLRFLLRAGNAAGKDSFFIAPTAVWFIWTNIRSKCIITSASFNQLQSQTESNIRTICQVINDQSGYKVFTVKKMCIICNDTGSVIWMFTTDDPGRAEGHHPFADWADSKVMIIVNEAKTVPDSIFEALSRCSYSYWLEVSSPGQTSGHFFNKCESAVEYPNPYPENYNGYYSRKITSYDCPHILAETIEFDKEDLGEGHPVFRSKHLADFTSVDENVVILEESIRKSLLFPCEPIDLGLGFRFGLDLAAGGDENVFTVIDGNRVVGSEKFRAHDTNVTVNLIIAFLQKYQFTKEQARKHGFADHGGMGASYAGHFRDKGWEFNWVLNQSKALRSDRFGNRGAELWFNFKRLIECNLILLPAEDKKLHKQLYNRYYKQHATQGKIVLLSKKEQKIKGHGSPDRADAYILAHTGLVARDFQDAAGITVERYKAPSNNTTPAALTPMQVLARKMDEKKYGEFQTAFNRYAGIGSEFKQKARSTGKHISNVLRKIYTPK